MRREEAVRCGLRPDARAAGKKEARSAELAFKNEPRCTKNADQLLSSKTLKRVGLSARPVISRRAGSTTDSRVAGKTPVVAETVFATPLRPSRERREKFISRSAAAQSGRKSAARQANDEYPLDLTPHPRLIPGLSDRSDPKSGSPLDEGGSRRSPGPSADRYAPSQEFHAHFRGVIALLRHPTAVTGRSDGRETRAIISYDAHQSDARSTEPRDVSGARTLLFAGTRFALHFFAFHDARGSFRDLGCGAGDVGPRVR